MLALCLRQHDKDLYEQRVTAHLESSPLRTLHPEEASLFVHPACLVDAYFRIRDGHVAGYWRVWRAIEALVLADMCLMQEARRNTVPTLPEEISPYFCDPSMNGDISYNGVLKGWPGAENTAANKTTLEAKKAELEAQLAAISLELQK